MPASYPGSAKTFTARSAGQTIASANINDLQDEVNAIETGLLAGTAPLTSSNTIVNNLSVLGTSTLVGNVTVTGNLSVTGSVSGGTRCKVTHSAKQEIPTATFTGLNWDTDTYDPSSMHSTSVNSSRITFTASTGAYQVGVNLEWNGDTGLVKIAKLVFNDVTPIGAQFYDGFVPGLVNQAMSVTGTVNAASTTDFVTVQAFHSLSTGSISTGGTYGLSFWAHKI